VGDGIDKQWNRFAAGFRAVTSNWSEVADRLLRIPLRQDSLLRRALLRASCGALAEFGRLWDDPLAKDVRQKMGKLVLAPELDGQLLEDGVKAKDLTLRY
jgi:hypothetical protein